MSIMDGTSKPIMVELFSGSAQMAAAFQRAGYQTTTVDLEEEFEPDWVVDVLSLTAVTIVERCGIPSVLWASPPCQCFSVCTMGRNWRRLQPTNEKARLAQRIVQHTLRIISDLQAINPTLVFFIENPRGMLRKMPFMHGIPRRTVTYCQYGDKRQKPTDIWTNSGMLFKPVCHPGMACHESAPRGSQRGTQGLANDYERGIIPAALCDAVAAWCKTHRPAQITLPEVTP